MLSGVRIRRVIDGREARATSPGGTTTCLAMTFDNHSARKLGCFIL